MTNFYHQGNRQLQDNFQSRALADRMDEIIIHSKLNDDDIAFIKSQNLFFISTVNDQGQPTVSHKGGPKGFVSVLDNKTLAYPGYDGNGMFLTDGNIVDNGKVGLLFIDLENPRRLRVHGTASVDTNDELLKDYHEALYVVRINIDNIFVNCPRYIHHYEYRQTSKNVPEHGVQTPEADWKSMEIFEDVLPDNKSE